MSIKTYRPITPARRHMTVSGFDGVDKHACPEKILVEVKKKNAGRNSYGRITVRHHGGGNRQKYRIIDFKRDKRNVEAQVLRLEYDPNRSAYIALVEYPDSERRYILAPGRPRRSATCDRCRRGRRHQAGQRSASGEHPRGHRHPQHRNVPGQGCAARPLRRQRRAADGEGRRCSRPSVCRPAKCARSA